MVIDNTLARIISETQKAFNDKYNIDLSFDEVHDIVEVQMTTTVFGFTKNIAVHWKGFLKFIWVDKKSRKAKFDPLFKEINDNAVNLTDKEKEYYLYLAGVAASSAKRELEILGQSAKALSKEEINNLPTTTNTKFRQFTCLIKQR